MPEIEKLFDHMRAFGASDLHLKSGQRPRFRVRGELISDAKWPVLSAADIEQLMHEVLSEEQVRRHAEQRRIDFVYENPQLVRFRCNYFHDYWGPAAVWRLIPIRVPTLVDLELPASLAHFAHLNHGLVLVTGPIRSGKTSTLAALVDIVNENASKHIITLEDPLEFLHVAKRAVMHQRGMHYDFSSFETSIVEAMQQDPDLLVIGKLPDVASARHALQAAERGVLVFATLQTTNATDSVEAIIDTFPPCEQAQARIMLSQSLKGVVSQVLVSRADGSGQVAATEILKVISSVSTSIREDRSQDLPHVIHNGKDQGMHSLDDSLLELVTQGVVEADEAYIHAVNKQSFENLLRGAPGMRPDPRAQVQRGQAGQQAAPRRI